MWSSMKSPVTAAVCSPASPLSLLLYFLLFAGLPGGAPDLAGDAAALLAFRSAVGPFALPWNASAPSSPCSWQGVSCESNRVAALRLPAVGLIGQIPAGTVANLTALRTLSLRFNALAGPLPPDLSNLSELRNLYLQRNRFSGEFPASIASLKNLVRLNLADNQFSGGIPLGLNDLPRLATLYLESNRLAGEIPALDLPNLALFNVSFNQLNGSIPPTLRAMPASAFLATGLCGGPLAPCPGETAPTPAANGPAAAGAGIGSEPKGKKHKLSGGAIAGIAIGAAVFALAVLILFILLCKRSSGGSKTQSLETTTAAGRKPPEGVSAADRDIGFGEVNGNGNPRSAAMTRGGAPAAAGASGEKKLVFFRPGVAPFDLEDLLRASAEVLGKGTYGTAYKALLETGATVVVKRLRDVALSEREFRERIEPVGTMDHPKLVPLKAYYYSKDEKFLVYDYMPMGSLSALLHGNRGAGRTPLNWEKRTSIALAAAQGIEYIHSTVPSASHGNIKSSNILLSKPNDARVSDHGLSLLVVPSSNPTRIAGYRAPEVTDPRKVSQKADVYSFGVLLLELLTGKAPAQALLNEEGIDLPRWVQSVVREEWTSEVFDAELLRDENVEEEMVQLLQLAIDCTAQYPDKRPSMAEVASLIEEIRRSTSGAGDQAQINGSIEDGDEHSSRTDSTGGA